MSAALTDVELVDGYAVHQVARGFSATTIRRRRSTLRTFGAFVAPKSLTDATTVDIEQWLATRRTARTRHACRSDLRGFYRWAAGRGLVGSDPAAGLASVRVPKSLPRPVGPEVAAALCVGRRRTRRMVALGLLAGLRVAEIANLDAEDVQTHLEPPLLVVRGGKGGKDRVIPMHPVLADMLAGLRSAGPIFPNRDGRPISPESVSRTISAQLARVGIDANPHRLRHTFGTDMAHAANGNLVAVAAAMGHESTNTTMGYVGWSGEGADIIAAMFTRRDGTFLPRRDELAERRRQRDVS